VGRQYFAVALTAIAVISAPCLLHGQGQPKPHRQQHPGGGGNLFGRPGGLGNGNPNRPFNPARDRLNQLSPEERQVFQRNAERWLQMTPEQRRVLREREQARQRQLKADAEAAMRQMGLRLDPNAQGQFEARYSQERRRMERQLREEAEAKRQQELPQLNEKLKNEFQGQHQSSSSGSPSVAPASPAATMAGEAPSIAPSGPPKPRR
jgi:hypothetical protein